MNQMNRFRWADIQDMVQGEVDAVERERKMLQTEDYLTEKSSFIKCTVVYLTLMGGIVRFAYLWIEKIGARSFDKCEVFGFVFILYLMLCVTGKWMQNAFSTATPADI